MKTQSTSVSFFLTLFGSILFSIIPRPQLLETIKTPGQNNSSQLKFVENVWSNETLELLTEMFRADALPSLSADDIPDSEFDNIGESRDPYHDGSCPMRYTINKRGNKW